MVWPGIDERQHFFGDLELRRGFLERRLLGERGLLFGARPALCGEADAEQKHDEHDQGTFHETLLEVTGQTLISSAAERNMNHKGGEKRRKPVTPTGRDAPVAAPRYRDRWRAAELERPT